LCASRLRKYGFCVRLPSSPPLRGVNKSRRNRRVKGLSVFAQTTDNGSFPLSAAVPVEINNNRVRAQEVPTTVGTGKPSSARVHTRCRVRVSIHTYVRTYKRVYDWKNFPVSSARRYARPGHTLSRPGKSTHLTFDRRPRYEKGVLDFRTRFYTDTANIAPMRAADGRRGDMCAGNR